MNLVTLEQLNRYELNRTLTQFQKQMAHSLRELMRQRDDLTAENARLAQRVADLEQYDSRAQTRPTVLLVQDLGLNGAVAAYERGGVKVESIVVYPWQRMSEALASAGRQWVDAPFVEYLRSPYADTLSATRALELESKRAAIEGMDKVIEMKQAISDAVDLIAELAPYKDKYLQEVAHGVTTGE